MEQPGMSPADKMALGKPSPVRDFIIRKYDFIENPHTSYPILHSEVCLSHSQFSLESLPKNESLEKQVKQEKRESEF